MTSISPKVGALFGILLLSIMARQSASQGYSYQYRTYRTSTYGGQDQNQGAQQQQTAYAQRDQSQAVAQQAQTTYGIVDQSQQVAQQAAAAVVADQSRAAYQTYANTGYNTQNQVQQAYNYNNCWQNRNCYQYQQPQPQPQPQQNCCPVPQTNCNVQQVQYQQCRQQQPYYNCYYQQQSYNYCNYQQQQQQQNCSPCVTQTIQPVYQQQQATYQQQQPCCQPTQQGVQYAYTQAQPQQQTPYGYSYSG